MENPNAAPSAILVVFVMERILKEQKSVRELNDVKWKFVQTIRGWATSRAGI